MHVVPTYLWFRCIYCGKVFVTVGIRNLYPVAIIDSHDIFTCTLGNQLIAQQIDMLLDSW